MSDHTEDSLRAHLKNLDELSYQQERKTLASKFEKSLRYLDKLFKDVHRENGGSGTTIEFEEIVPTGDPVDGVALLDRLRDSVRRYVILPDGAAEVVVLWVAFSWCHNFFRVSPILAIQSPQKGSGKTTLLDWLTRSVPRPLPASHATTAAIFRVIEKLQPTLLIDEADAFLKNNEQMRALLNSGHDKASAQVIRAVDVRNDHVVKTFSSWAPKVIAGIGHLSDTLQDRSIALMLHRKRSNETVERFRIGRDEHDFLEMKIELAGLAHQLSDTISDHEPDLPAGLSNRAGDNWEPLITIADLVGGHWPDTIRAIAETRISQNDTDVKTQLLKDIKGIFDKIDSERISTKDLLSKLYDIDDSPWSEHNRGKEISPRQLAGLLNLYGIKPEMMRVNGQPIRGYNRTSFIDTWERYLPLATVSMRCSVTGCDNSIQDSD